MEWTQDHVLELIDLLYGKPELWDQKANRNKQLQIEALKDMALKMGRDVREVEKKLNYLRSQFSREWLRVRRSKSNNEDYEPKWFAFKPLSFLIYKRHINKPIQDKVTNFPLFSLHKISKKNYLLGSRRFTRTIDLFHAI